MDATLNAGNIRVDRSSLMPDVGEPMYYTWARKCSEQTVRTLGLFGSAFIPFQVDAAGIPVYPTSAGPCNAMFSTHVQLPDGYYGSTKPPMIEVHVQYGSMAIYKQVRDYKGAIRHQDVFGESKKPLLFVTYINHLEHDGTRWSFDIIHEVEIDRTVSLWPQYGHWMDAAFKPPYQDMSWGWWPDLARLTTAEYAVLRGVVLHWTAFGIDPNI